MSYSKSYTAWADYPNTSTPATAAKFQNMDDGISTLDGQIVAQAANTAALSAVAVAAIPKSTGSTSGDMIYFTAASTPTRLAAGTNGQILSTSAGLPKWITSSGGAALAATAKSLSADVSMASANTYYDGPSIALSAGTYLLTGQVTATGSTSRKFTAKLWDGGTTTVSTERSCGGGDVIFLSLSGLVTLGGSGTMRISVAATVATSTMYSTAPDNGAGATASTLTAVQIA